MEEGRDGRDYSKEERVHRERKREGEGEEGRQGSLRRERDKWQESAREMRR